MNQTPTLRLAHFNPDLQSKEDMKRGFIARQSLLNRMLDDLRRETGQSTPQHKLIVGQRGMGKTSLLRRLRYAVEDDADLSPQWLPLIFPEEQYNIARLSDFWLNCLDALGDALEDLGDEAQAERIDALRDALPKDEAQRSEATLTLLLEQAQALGKRLILLIDNLDIVLERLTKQDWEIRRILSAEPRLLLIGATSRAIPAAYDYGRAFYDFFRVHELKGLSEQETRDVLRQLSELRGQPQVAKILDDEPGRIHALHSLSGGNPRTVVLLYEVLETGFEGNARHDLERLLDLYTPLYKARFEEFPAQSQQVIDALSIHWDPMLAGELADTLRLNVNTASAQLTRLYEQGMVEKVALFEEKKQGFQIAERFFNIWYLMRASRRVRRRLVWLVRFLETWFADGELNQHAQTHLNHADGDRERHAEYSFALAQAVRHAPLRTALELDGLHALIDDGKLHRLVDLSDLPPDLKDKKDRMVLLAELKKKVLGLQRDWQGIDPQEFWRLLGGSPFLALNEKQRIVDELGYLTYEKLKQLYKNFKKKKKKILHIYNRERDSINKLYEILSRGDMADSYDWEDARAIAEDERYRRLPYIAVYSCLYGGSKMTDINNEALDKAEGFLIKMSNDELLSAYGWNGLGLLLADYLQNYEEAIKAFYKAIDIEPTFSWPWHNIGYIFQYSLHKYREAEEAYKQAIAIDPLVSLSWIHLGNLYRNHLNQYKEAELAYRRAISINPDDDWAWIGLGALFEENLQMYKDAEHAYRQALILDPEDAKTWTNLGNLLQYNLQRYEDSENSYRQAIKLDRNFADPWNCLGNLLAMYFKRYEEAEAAYWQAIAIDRKSSLARNNLLSLGRHWLRDSEHAKAESLSRRLTETFPEDAPAWLLLAEVEAKQGRHSDALADLRRWLDLTAAKDEAAEAGEGFGGALPVFAELAQAGWVAALLEALEKTGLDERWRPLYEALKAVAAGSAQYLTRVAPEVRRPALDILKTLAPALVEENRPE